MAWFLVWIPKKEEEKRRIQEEQGRKLTEARRQEEVEGAGKEQQEQQASKKEIQEAGDGQGSLPVDTTLESPKVKPNTLYTAFRAHRTPSTQRCRLNDVDCTLKCTL